MLIAPGLISGLVLYEVVYIVFFSVRFSINLTVAVNVIGLHNILLGLFSFHLSHWRVDVLAFFY